MLFRNWVKITNGICEYNIYLDYSYYEETKERMLNKFGDREIERILIDAYDDGDWIVANIFFKNV